MNYSIYAIFVSTITKILPKIDVIAYINYVVPTLYEYSLRSNNLPTLQGYVVGVVMVSMFFNSLNNTFLSMLVICSCLHNMSSNDNLTDASITFCKLQQLKHI